MELRQRGSGHAKLLLGRQALISLSRSALQNAFSAVVQKRAPLLIALRRLAELDRKLSQPELLSRGWVIEVSTFKCDRSVDLEASLGAKLVARFL